MKTTVLLCLALALFALSGCQEPTTTNPWQPEGPRLTAEQLEAEAGDRLAATEDWAAQELAGHEAAIARVQKEVDATRASIARRVSAGMTDIERQHRQREGWVGVVNAGSGLADLVVPGLGSVLTGAIGVAIGRAGRKRLADQTWDEAQRAKEAEVLTRDQTWDAAKQEARAEDPLAKLVAIAAPLLIAKLAPEKKP